MSNKTLVKLSLPSILVFTPKGKREEAKLLGKVKADLHHALLKIRHIWCYQPAAVACS